MILNECSFQKILILIFKRKNVIKYHQKDSLISKYANIGQPVRFRNEENQLPRALKLQFRPVEDTICCLCSQWTEDNEGEPLSISLESRLFLNGIFYQHGELGFRQVIIDSHVKKKF